MLRIDKWLWAARFYKTRSLAKQAIEAGKVHCQGERIKASRNVTVGMMLTIRQSWDIKEVEVIALSDTRRGATEAATLYQETQSSLEKRTREAEQRKALKSLDQSTGRPTKKQRRQIHRFKDLMNEI